VLTFKDLKKKVSLATQQQNKFFERLQNKPFWIWNIEEHKQEDIKTNGDCCFNHIIGLPGKGKIQLTITKRLVNYVAVINILKIYKEILNAIKIKSIDVCIVYELLFNFRPIYKKKKEENSSR
jgi:hypothetical protein